jgi:hypothetical protein
MAPTIVYVHGNGNKPAGDQLKDQWDRALFGHPMGESSRMAYWASLRYPNPLPSGPAALSPPGAQEATVAAMETPEQFIAATLREVDLAPRPVAGGPGAGTLDVADPLESWLRDMTFTAEALAGGDSAGPPMAIPSALPLPASLRKAAFRALVKVAFKDVHAYFFDGFGDRMRAVLQAELADLPGPVVLIGHSLGSIIAYDVLRDAANSGLETPLFLTVGSPLAVTEIQDLVRTPLQVPASVIAWHNASDSRDLVALDKTIRPEYTPADRCTDLFVVNDSDNHHGIDEYLRATAVQDAVHAVFGNDTAGGRTRHVG